VKQLVVIGNPIEHSLSPIMHNAALKAMGLDQEYSYDKMLLHTSNLKKFIVSLESGLITGANVTIPFKTTIIPLLTNLSKEAAAIGAVNTICRKGTKLIGSNTDVHGFLNVLHENNVEIEDSHVLIIGAGGAARSVIYGLVSHGASQFKIYNRSKLRTEELVVSINQYSDVNVETYQFPSYGGSMDDIDLLVNCTPVGMSGHSVGRSPLNRTNISKNTTVIDLVYNPARTKLIEDAGKMGCKIIDGIGMLVHQGALSFESWIGFKPPQEVMKNAVLQFLEGSA